MAVRIAVDGEHARAGRRVEDGAGVAAGAERAVNVGCAGLRRERLQHFGKQHGNVARCPSAGTLGRGVPRRAVIPVLLPRRLRPPTRRRPAPNNLRWSWTFSRALRAPLFEARGLPHLEFLAQADKSDVGRKAGVGAKRFRKHDASVLIDG